MVEHLLAKEKAAGSNPVFRSILHWNRSTAGASFPMRLFVAFRVIRTQALFLLLRQRRFDVVAE